MPKRRTKWSTKKRPLDFAESPLNGRQDLPTPVHCSLYPPVTADIVPVEQIAASWISPQFEGKLLRGETVGRRLRRRPPGAHTRAPSLDSSSRRFTDAEPGSRPRPRQRQAFCPLQFVLHRSSEVERKTSDDESTSEGGCGRLERDGCQRRGRSAPVEGSEERENEEEDGNRSIANSFTDIVLIGRHLNVRTPDDSQSNTDRNTTLPLALVEDANLKQNLSRRLFQQTITETDCSEIPIVTAERLPSLEDVCNRRTILLEVNSEVAPPLRTNDATLSHLSFESKDDSMFVGCLPHVNPLDGSAFLQLECSLSQDDTLDISKSETKNSHGPLNAGAMATIPLCQPLLRLPCQILSSITRETPPQSEKELNILVRETPVSYRGLTYRQKQLKGFL